ncbi:MAG: hypothetical protein KKE79_07610 [Actinobacteria bacterium]|nr:hypothetical protein [Actinomycetota bacterium]MBU4301760.1 hypothetical protein [Actinomycetota bacterium]MBU4490486.1 hypothetical protein [Actinomycetota bacterium]MCG2796822.1 hypothetical protein [Actinomycetes bacterium]
MIDEKKCWEIKKCSAAQYLNCKAFKEDMKCWEVSNPRGSRSMLLCLQMGCPVYEMFMAEIDHEIEYRLRMMFPFLSSIEEEQKAP